MRTRGALIRRLRRFRSLDRVEQRLMLEAMFFFVLVRVGLRVLNFGRLQRLLELPRHRRRTGTSEALVDRISRMVAVVAPAAFPRATCLDRALVADAMLRRRGFHSQLNI